jgi:hypothetical protein
VEKIPSMQKLRRNYDTISQVIFPRIGPGKFIPGNVLSY